jgi:hypothetical protein
MSTLTSTQAQAMARSRRRFGRQTAKTQLLDMQAVLLRCVLDPDTKPSDAAQCARAFDVLEERIRILRGKPLPGQLRPDLVPKPQRRLPTFTALDVIDVKESLLPEPPVPAPPPGGGRL